MSARDVLRDMRERLDDTAGWLEWISPRATTEIAVVYADGDVYLPTGGAAEEFAFANAQGRVYPLMRKDGVPALVEVVEAVLESLREVIDEKPDYGRLEGYEIHQRDGQVELARELLDTIEAALEGR